MGQNGQKMPLKKWTKNGKTVSSLLLNERKVVKRGRDGFIWPKFELVIYINIYFQ